MAQLVSCTEDMICQRETKKTKLSYARICTDPLYAPLL